MNELFSSFVALPLSLARSLGRSLNLLRGYEECFGRVSVNMK